MPKLSIIMGIYNSGNEKMLNNSIDSILNQSYTDFELIICEDGSKDNTLKLLEEIAKKDTRIKLIKNFENLGLAASLNKCIEIAEGEYIGRQDADDISDHLRFQKQIDFLDNEAEYDFIGSNISLFDENKIWGEFKLKEKPKPKDFLFNVPFIHATVVMRKDILLSIGCYRVANETYRTEDIDLFMRFYSLGHRGYNIQEKLYICREDKNAYKRRKYRYRIDEAIVKYKGFKAMGLMPRAIPYIVKPLIVGLIPQKLLGKIRNIVFNRLNKI